MDLLLTNKLIQLIKSSKHHVSKDWLKVHSKFFHGEHLEKFARHLLILDSSNSNLHLPLPHFSEEITPKRALSFAFFSSTLAKLKEHDFETNSLNKKEIASLVHTVPFEQILLIMGQRQTPATIKTVDGLPLLKQEMIDSCLQPYNKQISYGVRAWEKHVDRSENTFWGEIKGTPQQKQTEVLKIINNMIENHTWWNTFYHYKHQIVFEIRIASGHGIRWSVQDKLLIGFLEPFL
ncbi:hypothetical protein LX97_01458 [Nonlabens dokdonensis]|jgi:hypothetical protein|uniref:Uncharacterized protein n=2 Tax=Nonlabens dokdonensis TaxID=328515 RepID=A0ABX5Q3C8_9FLAO|nr:hypothetical protein [Nonlabens dokdonensis]AGC76803.1 putative proFAR isomerase associated [Nonlabens dokdonensis DSW-6]PZX44447.1 hypothetical protein LX97_01458 [Nonlabens dokdonensis]